MHVGTQAVRPFFLASFNSRRLMYTWLTEARHYVRCWQLSEVKLCPWSLNHSHWSQWQCGWTNYRCAASDGMSRLFSPIFTRSPLWSRYHHEPHLTDITGRQRVEWLARGHSIAKEWTGIQSLAIPPILGRTSRGLGRERTYFARWGKDSMKFIKKKNRVERHKQLHMWTHTDCNSTHKTCTSSSRTNSHHNGQEVSGTLMYQGAIGTRKLLGEEELVFFNGLTECSSADPTPMSMYWANIISMGRLSKREEEWENTKMGGKGSGEDLEGVRGGVDMVKIYYMTIIYNVNSRTWI